MEDYKAFKAQLDDVISNPKTALNPRGVLKKVLRTYLQ